MFGPVAHLATPIRGELLEPAPSALELARLPAPHARGRRHAARRGRSPPSAPSRASTAVATPARSGWVDARGDGEWAIALRGRRARRRPGPLVAGAGIVAGSDPDAEWAETQAKLEPMLRALVRP